MDLLFASGSKREFTSLGESAIKDLAIQDILEAISGNERDIIILKEIISSIPKDIRDSVYRQEIMKDFLASDEFTDDMDNALGLIKTLKDYGSSRTMMRQNDSTLYTLLENLRELSVYVEVIENLYSCLDKYEVKAKGLCDLRDNLKQVIEDDKFEEAKADIETILEDLSCVRSANVGVTFTPDMNIDEVKVVDFVPYKIKSKYKFAEIAAEISNIMNASNQNIGGPKPMVNTKVVDPLLVAMAPVIEKHLKRHFVRMKSVMSKYVNMDSSSMIQMYEGLVFYINMARFGRRIVSEGEKITFPEFPDSSAVDDFGRVPSEKCTFEINDLYNVRLFISHEKNIVKNDFSFKPSENLFILTGPNRGGKTIIEQALGIISLLAAAGCYVTASKCKGVPFSNILTHFPIDENLTINYGRLGEEAVRIKEIVGEADNRTLILFNETYSTTSAEDGLYLSKDLLRVLKEKGSAVIFNTHIHEVARSIEDMNKWNGESKFVSLIMEIVNNENTFKVKRSEPDSCSYAMNIARKYGITYEQMIGKES